MNVNQLLLKFFKDHKGYLAAYMFFMVAYPITSVYLPKYYGQIVDAFKSGKEPKFKMAAILLTITTLMFIGLEKLDATFVPKLQAYIRMNIVKVVLENYNDNFKEQELGDLISKIVKLPLVVRELLHQIRDHVIPIVLILIMVVIRFTTIDRRLGMLALTGILSVFAVMLPLTKKCLHISSEMDGVSDSIHEDISELFDNLMDVYSMNTCQQEIQNLEKRQDEIVKRYTKTFTFTNNVRITMTVMSILICIIILAYSYHLFKRKEMALDNLVNVAVTSMLLMNKIINLASRFPTIIFNLGSYIITERYLSDLQIDDVPKENFTISRGEVVFRDLNIKYGDKQVIKNLNFTVKPNDSVAIIGKIGSGKSSIVKALLKLVPYKGEIFVDGKNIKSLNPSSIRSQIIYVRQNPIPFNRTLFENIAYGNDSVTEEKVKDLFKRYNLSHFFKHDLHASVGKKGGNLSGGQRQMIFLLRIMLSDKPIIILDEPTSSLDSASGKYIMRILNDLMSERTVILITHDTKLGNLAKRKLEL